MREPAAEAASVATRLLAFYREPVSHRPLYIHGREPLPSGYWVLRFAHGRFSQPLMRDFDPEERDVLRNAALAFIRQVCLWDGATHYQLLCAEPDARREVLKRNYRLIVGLIHPDKLDASADPWPLDSAQRINAAYETLADDSRRAAYDQGLRKVEHEHSPFIRVPAKVAHPLSQRTFGILAAVVALLVFAQVAWINGHAPDHSVLESMRPGTLRDAQPPRFMSGANALAAAPAFTARDDTPPLQLPRIEAEGHPVAAAVMPEAKPVPIPRETRSAAPPAAHPLISVASSASDAPPAPAPAPASAPHAEVRVAQAAPAPVATPPKSSSPPANKDVELLVAKLVSAYEAGDAGQLMSLYEGGFWQSATMQQSYANFFRATRSRRLRIDNLTWSSSAESARAKGVATVIADYNDDTARLERQVDVELDINLVGGRLRFTRLSLFPNRS
jgi:hypothetical protein